MKKTSTLVYSVHDLASKANNEILNANDFDSRIEFEEVTKMLEMSKLYDVRQDVIDRILLIANSI